MLAKAIEIGDVVEVEMAPGVRVTGTVVSDAWENTSTGKWYIKVEGVSPSNVPLDCVRAV